MTAVAKSPALAEAERSKDEAILALLGKLALHYWRPDFTPGQAKQLYGDYLADLRPYPFRDIAEAISAHRRDHQARFYPTVGELLARIERRPSWDVGTHAAYAKGRRAAARDELAAMSGRLALAAPGVTP